MSFHLEITTGQTAYERDGDGLAYVLERASKEIGHKVALADGGLVEGAITNSLGDPIGTWVYEGGSRNHVVELRVELTMTKRDGHPKASAELAEELVQDLLDEQMPAENIGVYVTNHYEEG